MKQTSGGPVKGCPHCDAESAALRHVLHATNNFRIVCDSNPLSEGHILVIPRAHIPCLGAFPACLLSEYAYIHEAVRRFHVEVYQYSLAFEHGVVGQTVFHAHVHFLPASLSIVSLVPEEKGYRTVAGIGTLRKFYGREGRYLFLQIEQCSYVVNLLLARPRFFRDRIAAALNVPARGNWKIARADGQVNQTMDEEILRLKQEWQKWRSTTGQFLVRY